MSARSIIRSTAAILSWTQTTSKDDHDVLTRGDKMIDLLYRTDGSVQSGRLYSYFTIDNLHLTDEIYSAESGKKEGVLAWLAE